MKTPILKTTASFTFIIFISLITSSCSNIELKSNWKNQDIIIDGNNNEWQNGTFIENANVFISIYNDEEFLYLGISSSDRQLPMQIMSGGLTMWFDPDGKKNKIFGIRYPSGQNHPGIPFTEGSDNINSEKLRPKFPDIPDEYDVIENDDVVETNLRMNNKGIQIKIGPPEKRFFYEMKIPLKSTDANPFAIGTDISKTISIGFETMGLNRGKMRGRMEEGIMPPNDRGDLTEDDERMERGGIRDGGKERFGGRPGNMDASKPLNIWFNVQLSSNR